MTIREIIEEVDETKPNAYSEKLKLRWISLLDGLIATNLMMIGPEEVRETYNYHYPEDLEREPLVYFPHDEIYPAWLKAQIDKEDHEDSLYQNSIQDYNAIYKDFAVNFLNSYDPAQEG